MNHQSELAQRRQTRIAGLVLGGAIVVAPFLAFLYSPTAGLVVMTVALSAIAATALDAARRAAPTNPRGRQLRLAAGMNIGLAAICAIIAIVRIV